MSDSSSEPSQEHCRLSLHSHNNNYTFNVAELGAAVAEIGADNMGLATMGFTQHVVRKKYLYNADNCAALRNAAITNFREKGLNPESNVMIFALRPFPFDWRQIAEVKEAIHKAHAAFEEWDQIYYNPNDKELCECIAQLCICVSVETGHLITPAPNNGLKVFRDEEGREFAECQGDIASFGKMISYKFYFWTGRRCTTLAVNKPCFRDQIHTHHLTAAELSRAMKF